MNYHYDEAEFVSDMEKREAKINENIRKAFIIEVGYIPLHLSNCFPVAYESCVHTEDRTWYGRLTVTGKHKKGSFVEDK